MCTFAVQTVICGNITSDLSDYFNVTTFVIVDDEDTAMQKGWHACIADSKLVTSCAQVVIISHLACDLFIRLFIFIFYRWCCDVVYSYHLYSCLPSL